MIAIKVQLFWEGHKIYLIVLTLLVTKFLWPSQKSWTLTPWETQLPVEQDEVFEFLTTVITFLLLQCSGLVLDFDPVMRSEIKIKLTRLDTDWTRQYDKYLVQMNPPKKRWRQMRHIHYNNVIRDWQRLRKHMELYFSKFTLLSLNYLQKRKRCYIWDTL